MPPSLDGGSADLGPRAGGNRSAGQTDALHGLRVRQPEASLREELAEVGPGNNQELEAGGEQLARSRRRERARDRVAGLPQCVIWLEKAGFETPTRTSYSPKTGTRKA